MLIPWRVITSKHVVVVEDVSKRDDYDDIQTQWPGLAGKDVFQIINFIYLNI